MTKLSVNLNKIALLRNSRTIGIPRVVRAAVIALDSGAHGITVHPRPDGRHIRTADVRDLAAILKRYPGAEFNIEGNPFQGVLDIVREVLPSQATLVPDDPGALTSDHGWDIGHSGSELRQCIGELKALGVRVSLFMDPVPEAMSAVKKAGADRVELYTEPYARAFGTSEEKRIVARYADAARAAQAAGLAVNAGHDLNLQNLPRFLATVPGVLEVSIGHALVADALEQGLAATVRAYLAALAPEPAGKAAVDLAS